MTAKERSGEASTRPSPQPSPRRGEGATARHAQHNPYGATLCTGPCNTPNTLFATPPIGPNLSVIIPINR